MGVNLSSIDEKCINEFLKTSPFIISCITNKRKEILFMPHFNGFRKNRNWFEDKYIYSTGNLFSNPKNDDDDESLESEEKKSKECGEYAMICPECNCQFDLYNAVVNDNTGQWICPDCQVPLSEDDIAL